MKIPIVTVQWKFIVGERQSCSDNPKICKRLLVSSTHPEESERSSFYPEALEKILSQDDFIKYEKDKTGGSQK